MGVVGWTYSVLGLLVLAENTHEICTEIESEPLLDADRGSRSRPD